MNNRLFVLSDVHGNYDEMMALYEQLPINPKKDQLIVLGDFIDRGPDTKKVVEQLMKWKKKYPHWQILYGNHEDLMLDALMYGGRIYDSYYLWYSQGGRETFYSYIPENLTEYEKQIIQVKDAIPQEHLEWIAGLPRFYQTEDYIFVHGGLKPGKTVEETETQDILWIRDEFIDSDYDWSKKVIFGHTPDFENLGMPIVMDNKIGIDGAIGAPGFKNLIGLELPSEKFYFEKHHSNLEL